MAKLHFNIVIKWLDRIIRGLKKSKTSISDTILLTNEEALRDFTIEITTYPPLTAGNEPPPPYWSRGIGRIHSDGRVDPVSEQFGGPAGNEFSWDIISFEDEAGVTSVAQTNVSYAPWVVSTEQQMWFHDRNGWSNIKQTLDFLGISGDEVLFGESVVLNQKLRERIIDTIRRAISR